MTRVEHLLNCISAVKIVTGIIRKDKAGALYELCTYRLEYLCPNLSIGEIDRVNTELEELEVAMEAMYGV